jgi:hypothetical protein
LLVGCGTGDAIGGRQRRDLAYLPDLLRIFLNWLSEFMTVLKDVILSTAKQQLQ